MEKYLIHSNELHLIDAEKIHQAVEKLVESLDLAAGSTTNFNLYQVVENYFKDLEKRRKINPITISGPLSPIKIDNKIYDIKITLVEKGSLPK